MKRSITAGIVLVLTALCISLSVADDIADFMSTSRQGLVPVERAMRQEEEKLAKINKDLAEQQKKWDELAADIAKLENLRNKLQDMGNRNFIKFWIKRSAEIGQTIKDATGCTTITKALKETIKKAYESFNKTSETETDGNILVQMSNMKNAAIAEITRLQDTRNQLNSKMNELYSAQRDQQSVVAQKQEAYREAKNDSDNAIYRFVSQQEKMIDDAKEAQKASIRKAIDTAANRSGGSSLNPDFSPFINAHNNMVTAVLNNTFPDNLGLRSEWGSLQNKAAAYYNNSLSKATKQNDKTNVKLAYHNYTTSEKAMMAKLEKEGKKLLEKADGSFNKIMGIQTSFIGNFQQSDNSRRKVLGTAPVKGETFSSISDLQQRVTDLKKTAESYGAYSEFLESNAKTFTDRILAAEKTMNAARDDLRALEVQERALVRFVGGVRPPQGYTDEIKKIENGKKFLDGVLSPANRAKVKNTAVAAEASAEKYSRAVELNQDMANYLSRFSGLVSALTAHVSSAKKYVKKIKGEDGYHRIAYVCSKWFNNPDRHTDSRKMWLAMDREEKKQMRYTSVDDHRKNLKAVQEIIDFAGKNEDSFNTATGLRSAVSQAESILKSLDALTETNKNNRNSIMSRKNVNRLYVLGDFFTVLGGSMKYFKDYEEAVKELEKFESGYAGALEAYNASLTSILNEVSTATDGSKFIGRYFDKNGRFIGGERQQKELEEKYYDWAVQSDKIYKLDSNLTRLRNKLFMVSNTLIEKYLTGPTVEKIIIAGKSITEGYSYDPFSFDMEELAPDGTIQISGKLRVPGAAVNSVLISVNNGVTFTGKAALKGKDGFVYNLKPEQGVPYKIKVKAVDTRNNEGRTFPWSGAPDIIYTGISQKKALQDVFDAIAESYENKDKFAFMKNVSLYYRGRYENLERAVQLDFTFYDSITMKFYIDNITIANSKQQASVNVHWDRAWTNTQTGARETQSGTNLFKFNREDNTWKLAAYSGTPIFGIAQDLSIASPIVQQNAGDGVLATVSLMVHRNQVLRNHWSWGDEYCGDIGFSFAYDKYTTFDEFDIVDIEFVGDPFTPAVHPGDTGGIYMVGAGTLDSVVTAPEFGYVAEEDAVLGNVYIVKCSNGKYAKLRITNINTTADCLNNATSITFDWAYQPDGSRNVQ